MPMGSGETKTLYTGHHNWMALSVKNDCKHTSAGTATTVEKYLL